MNILFTLNDAFVPQVATCMCSIFENNQSAENIAIYLVGEKISEKNKEKLAEFTQNYDHTIHFIELNDLTEYIDFDFDTNGWSSIVLARLLLDKLLPSDLDKILYLDGDTLVLDDLSDLWNMDLLEKSIGMGPESTVSAERREFLKMGNQLYCNAGVLLIDLQRWRERRLGKKVLEFYQQHNGNLFANDQDAINVALRDEIYVLSPRYNFFNIYFSYPYNVLKRLSKPATFISKEELDVAISHPAIVHYLGEERPWRKGNTHKLGKEYLHYLHKTPWKDTPMEEGWQLYFICFRIFNVVMKPFPMLRYRIINSLIPSFMKFRKRQLQKRKA